MHAIVTLLVITLCCIGIVEGGYRGLEYLMARATAQPANVPARAGAANMAGQAGTGKKHDHRIILARNLFGAIPGNGAGGLATEAPDTLAASGLGIVLMGTIGDHEGGDRAIILDQKTGKQQIYRQGDTLQGKSVREIRRGKVILTANGRDEVLDISEAAKLRSIANAAKAAVLPSKSQGLNEGEVAVENPAGDEGQVVDLQKQPHSEGTVVTGQSGKRIIRPVIIRPQRPSEKD
ncbi:MAG: hypothetical protein OEL83_15575 [Desulforhopalus sp.]|nr:hypothetical protein [Desulforhopalus sp.]